MNGTIPTDPSPPSLDEIAAVAERIAPHVLETPTVPVRAPELLDLLAPGTTIALKLELLQVTGSFKARGALANVLGLAPEARARGVVAVSAGNHAIAVAYAARIAGTSARVVMMESASPVRVARCRALGAEVELAPTPQAAFARVREIAEAEGRAFVHPFEGRTTSAATGTLGAEWLRQAPDLDAVIVPIGGGGLISGIAAAVRALAPGCAVYGVEPEGADSMRRSLDAGTPQALERVQTIADSLGAPHAAPYSFGLVQRLVDDVVLVSDDELRRALRVLFEAQKLAVEPAGAASTAALLGPLRERLAGARVGLIACGSTIDLATWSTLAAAG